MDSFVSWFLHEKGRMDTDSMGLVDIPGQGRGAVALKDIPEGYTLFTTPRSMTLSTRTSELPNLLCETTWRSLKLHKGWVGLILCMMWEESRGAESKWSEYLDALPKDFDTPMFWSEDELRELEGTAVLEKIGKEEAERDYHERLVPAVQSRPDIFNIDELSTFYSLENYHRTGSRILSRSFQVEPWQQGNEQDDECANSQREEAEAAEEEGNAESMEVDTNSGRQEADEADVQPPTEDSEEDDEDEDDPSNVAMVPMADMLNARYGSENAKLFYEPLELRMVTTTPIKAGEQIYNTYGDPPNSELLRRYGHVDLVPLPDDHSREGNPADVVEIRADLAVDVVSTVYKDVTADTLKERIDWWLEEGGDDVFILGTDLDLPDVLISFFKLLVLAPSEWEKARSKGKPPKPKLDQEARLQILPLALDLIERRLAKYPTNLEADESLLATPASSTEDKFNDRLRNALIVRIGEKRILTGCAAKYAVLLQEARAVASQNDEPSGKTSKPKPGPKGGAKREKEAVNQRKRKRGTAVDGDDEKARKRSGR